MKICGTFAAYTVYKKWKFEPAWAWLAGWINGLFIQYIKCHTKNASTNDWNDTVLTINKFFKWNLWNLKWHSNGKLDCISVRKQCDVWHLRYTVYNVVEMGFSTETNIRNPEQFKWIKWFEGERLNLFMILYHIATLLQCNAAFFPSVEAHSARKMYDIPKKRYQHYLNCILDNVVS